MDLTHSSLQGVNLFIAQLYFCGWEDWNDFATDPLCMFVCLVLIISLPYNLIMNLSSLVTILLAIWKHDWLFISTNIFNSLFDI